MILAIRPAAGHCPSWLHPLLRPDPDHAHYCFSAGVLPAGIRRQLADRFNFGRQSRRSPGRSISDEALIGRAGLTFGGRWLRRWGTAFLPHVADLALVSHPLLITSADFAAITAFAGAFGRQVYFRCSLTSPEILVAIGGGIMGPQWLDRRCYHYRVWAGTRTARELSV